MDKAILNIITELTQKPFEFQVHVTMVVLISRRMGYQTPNVQTSFSSDRFTKTLQNFKLTHF